MEEADKKTWMVAFQETQLGPFSTDELISKITAREFEVDVLVFCPGMTDWQKAYTIPELGLLPPIPKAKINNTILWIIALLPAFSTFVAIWLGRVSIKNVVWYAIVNAILCICDEKLAKKSGIKDSPSWGLGVVCLPIYIGFRARDTQKGFTCLWVWIASILLSFILPFITENTIGHEEALKPLVTEILENSTQSMKEYFSKINVDINSIPDFYPTKKQTEFLFYNPKCVAVEKITKTGDGKFVAKVRARNDKGVEAILTVEYETIGERIYAKITNLDQPVFLD